MVITKFDGVRLLTPCGEGVRINGNTPLEGHFDFSVARSLLGADLLEFCETKKGNILLVDEEGKLKSNKKNDIATRCYKYAVDKDGNQIDWIVGRAIFVPRAIFGKLVDEDNDENEDKST